jgi:trehalose 6-phosphate synthase/phosphatase
MLVTPVRDGMNLVAKEFVAARTDEDGVLILSEFAGAAAEMGEALLVNPYDVDAIAAAIRRGLNMGPDERTTRMRELRGRVKRQNLHRWTARYLNALGRAGAADPSSIRISAPADVAALAERLRLVDDLVVLLDYDGTLVPFTQVPDLAHPDAELLELLRMLASSNRAVHVVSGRGHDTLERWFGNVPIDLWAEHGVWHRPNDSRQWDTDTAVSPDWFNQARTILEWFTVRTPGSLIETKASALAWHYRMSDPEMGDEHARHLRRTLTAALHRYPVEILDGKKVVELRPREASKGRVVAHILKRCSRTPLILAVGDDRTDEDMFAVLPDSGVSIRVGPGPTRAHHRLADPQAVRSLVRSLIQ